jgi:prepilin-type N-terminal cleavage/methylation domain-containing protein
MKAGFSLIEVLIAATVASLVSIALFLLWGQIQKSAVRVDNTMSVTDRILLLQRQCEQDFMGICLPVSRPYAKPEKEESATGDDKKEKPKIVERVFYATTQTGDNLETLTFLTNNVLQVYWSAGQVGGAHPRPRIARVQYTLKKDESKKEKTVSYTLYRQEKYTLDPDDFTKEGKDAVRSYALITGIKELKVTYWQEVQSKKQEEADKNKPKIVKDVKKIAVWDLEKEKPTKDVFIRPIPIMIKIELSLWDMQKKKAYPYVAMIPVPIYVPNPAEEQKKKEPQVKSILAQLPIPERLKKDGKPESPTGQPAQTPAMPGMPPEGVVPINPLPQQVDAQVTIIADDKGTLLKNLLDGKDINAVPQQ